MYEVVIKTSATEIKAQDYFPSKAQVVRFIAQQTGDVQEFIRRQVDARNDSAYKRDTKGYRVEVFYS